MRMLSRNRRAVFGPCENHFRGFTLVELLVVIAIIGVLIGLLLPAVQAARESARRSTCSNHLKQIGLALLNFENAQKAFPMGNRWITSPTTNRSPWRIELMPFLEQQAFYDHVYRSSGNDERTSFRIDPNIFISTFDCPSTSLRRWMQPSTYVLQIPAYAGIMGAVPDPAGRTARNHTFTTGGIGADNGMLLINEAVSLKQCTDGTSKTIIVGENSGPLTINGQKKDYRSTYIGWGHLSPWQQEAAVQDKKLSQWASSGLTRMDQGGLTAVRQRNNLNQAAVPSGSNELTETGFGNSGCNVPLSSEHPNGLMILMVDGSVAFTQDSADFAVFQALCSRDDGVAANRDN